MQSRTLTHLFVALGLILCGCQVTPTAQAQNQEQEQVEAENVAVDNVVTNAEIGYPTPPFPYYHYRLDLDIPESSMLDVTVWVDGEKQRHVDVREASHEVNPDRPVTHYRPPMADIYVSNNYEFEDPYAMGWLAWQPGQQYELRVRVRLREGAQASDEDTVLEQTVQLTAPEDAQVFDADWQNYKSVVLTETAGLDRASEPVELLLMFYADQAETIENDLRVLSYDRESHAIAEVPRQVYDVKLDAREDDPMHPDHLGMEREEKAWRATRTARVLFQADVPARESRIYLIYYNNASAEAPSYEPQVTTGGPPPGLVISPDNEVVQKPPHFIENDEMRIVLHPRSGQLHEMTLKSIPDITLDHKLETNGAMHWTPEAWPPPRPWSHASDWKEPDYDEWVGPLGVITHTRDGMPYVPEVEASVSYEIYADKPYVILSSSTRVNESLPMLAMRNAEIAVKRGVLTHLAWFDPLENRIRTIDIDERMGDLDLILMDQNIPWITLYNPDTGLALGGVMLENSVAGLEHRPRTLEPYFYVTVGPFVYWSQAINLSGSGKTAGNQRIVEVPQGTHLWTKMGLVLYEIDDGANPHAPLLEWREKLAQPLDARITSEVQDRMPTVGTEIYINPGKTGWEERETFKEGEGETEE